MGLAAGSMVRVSAVPGKTAPPMGGDSNEHLDANLSQLVLGEQGVPRMPWFPIKKDGIGLAQAGRGL